MLKNQNNKWNYRDEYGFSFFESAVAIVIFSLVVNLFSYFVHISVRNDLLLSKTISRQVLRMKIERKMNQFVKNCFLPFWARDWCFDIQENTLVWKVDGLMVDKFDVYAPYFDFTGVEYCSDHNVPEVSIKYRIKEDEYESKKILFR